MGAAELCLSWDDHHTALVNMFDELLQSNTLVDCTIAAEGQYLKAHKIVLSACSPYFQMLFSQENEKNPIVVLKDMKFQELKAIIDFVYRGKVKVQDSELEEFLMAAESLQIKGLACHQKKKPPEKTVSKAVPKRVVSLSSSARKRRRTSPVPSVEEVAVMSPRADNHNDNNLAGDVILSSDIPVEVQMSSAAAPSSLSSVNCDQWRSPQLSAPSPQGEMPSDTRTVVKTEPEPEPEPVAEIFMSETKSEEYVDDMELLDTGEGNVDVSSGDPHPQQSSSQYSGFHPIFDSMEDSFLMSQTTEQSSSQGPESAVGLPPSCGPMQPASPVSMFQLQQISAPVATIEVATVNASCVDPASNIRQTAPHLSEETTLRNPQLQMRKSHLDALLSANNLPVQTLQCQICNVFFRNRYSLETHRRRHDKTSHYQCSGCNKTFGRNGDLLIHKRLVCVSSASNVSRTKPG